MTDLKTTKPAEEADILSVGELLVLAEAVCKEDIGIEAELSAIGDRVRELEARRADLRVAIGDRLDAIGHYHFEGRTLRGVLACGGGPRFTSFHRGFLPRVRGAITGP